MEGGEEGEGGGGGEGVRTTKRHQLYAHNVDVFTDKLKWAVPAANRHGNAKTALIVTLHRQ